MSSKLVLPLNHTHRDGQDGKFYARVLYHNFFLNLEEKKNNFVLYKGPWAGHLGGCFTWNVIPSHYSSPCSSVKFSDRLHLWASPKQSPSLATHSHLPKHLPLPEITLLTYTLICWGDCSSLLECPRTLWEWGLCLVHSCFPRARNRPTTECSWTNRCRGNKCSLCFS